MNTGPIHPRAPQTVGAPILAALWLLAVVAGFLALWIYKMRPGAEGMAAARNWPAQSRIHANAGRATLLLFAHPRCACTRASLSELAGLVARFHERLDAHVLLLAPPGEEPELARTSLWSSAERIPGVTVARDVGGTEAKRFGVETSCGVVLYDAAGKLAFRGGITAARGHEGDSFGRQRIAALLSGAHADRADAPVFGCALENEGPVRMAQVNDR
jgi:hypothetical protein